MLTQQNIKIRSLSEVINDFCIALDDAEISLSILLETFHERGIGMLLLILAAPMALPIPVPPGINIILATPLILLTFQQMIGAHTIWLPAKIKQKKIAGKKIRTMLSALIPWLQRIEVLSRPRLGWITQDGPSRIVGFLGLIMALAICIPVPLTNSVPSLGIALMAFGTTMRDGALVFAGALIGTAWVLLLIGGVVIFGPEAFDIIKETIKSLAA